MIPSVKPNYLMKLEDKMSSVADKELMSESLYPPLNLDPLGFGCGNFFKEGWEINDLY
jgi:hypothetical protein